MISVPLCVVPVVILTHFCRAARVDRGPLVAGDTIRLREQGAQGAAVDDRLAVEAEGAARRAMQPGWQDLLCVFL